MVKMVTFVMYILLQFFKNHTLLPAKKKGEGGIRKVSKIKIRWDLRIFVLYFWIGNTLHDSKIRMI